MCRKLILHRDIAWGCRCATSWCHLDLTFDLAMVTFSLKILFLTLDLAVVPLIFKILSGLYVGIRNVYKIDTM